MRKTICIGIAISSLMSGYGLSNKAAEANDIGAKTFLENSLEYQYHLEGSGAVSINAVELTGKKLTSEYSYTSGNEQRIGTNHLIQDSDGKYKGEWKTIADNGDIYQGSLWLRFNDDGTAFGNWTWDGMPNNYEIRIDKVAQNITDNRIYFTSLIYFKEDGSEVITEFQEKAKDLFDKYDLRLEKSFKIIQKGQIGSVENPIEQPNQIQIFSLPSMEAFQKYSKDDEYIELSKIRDAGLRKFNVILGSIENIDELKTPSKTPYDQRTYAVAFINFKENGKQGLVEFNKKGVESGLYEKYGMHLDEIITPKISKAVIGELDFETPQMILVFYLDDISKMPLYLNDPIYKDIAPLRDDGLKDYNFFIGKKQ